MSLRFVRFGVDYHDLGWEVDIPIHVPIPSWSVLIVVGHRRIEGLAWLLLSWVLLLSFVPFVPHAATLLEPLPLEDNEANVRLVHPVVHGPVGGVPDANAVQWRRDHHKGRNFHRGRGRGLARGWVVRNALLATPVPSAAATLAGLPLNFFLGIAPVWCAS
ncbi:hypothetical protein GGR54DRAFT_259768 [Hypoxylon sp. NC1633]|nr:hypothetical protein GGR54DRAFT_259768 [Hypoxylon sp. NC1633]